MYRILAIHDTLLMAYMLQDFGYTQDNINVVDIKDVLRKDATDS